jgi:hypothetical protein
MRNHLTKELSYVGGGLSLLIGLEEDNCLSLP